MTRSTRHLLLSPALAALVQAGMRIGLFDVESSEPEDAASVTEPLSSASTGGAQLCLKPL